MKRAIKRLNRLTDPEQVGGRNFQRASTIRTKQRMLDAMEKHLGVVLYAAKEAGISRKCHYLWMANDDDYKEKIIEMEEGYGDFVERKMYEAIQEKNTAMIIFHLKTKLKHRGYQERYEYTGAGGGEIKLAGNLNVSQVMGELPPAAIEDIIKKVIGGSGKAEQALARLVTK